MHGGWISSWLAGAVIALLSRPAIAAWPADGLPIAVAPGHQRLEAVVADGFGAVFVAWQDEAASQVRVQRVLADGSISPGWPSGGIAPSSTPSTVRANIKVAPDGTGGCFVAWDELWYGPFEGAFYVRLQRRTVDGALAPGWPSEGILLASGIYRDIALRVTVDLMTSLPDGSCVLVISSWSSGCHDGFCGSGASSSFARVSANGALLVTGTVESHCASADGFAAPWASAAVSDGGPGLFLTSYSPCSGLTHLRHLFVGEEGSVTLPVAAVPRVLALVADGSLVAKADVVGSGPTLFHWNPDGSPPPAFPASGIPLPASLYWDISIAASGASIYSWRPATTPAELRSLRLDGSGALSPGWDPSGLVLAGPPAVPDRYHNTSSDSAGGAYVVWTDARSLTSGLDIYASHVLANGSIQPGLPVYGYPLSEAAGNQWDPKVVTLEPGVAISVWHDGRTGAGTGADLYAQLLRHDTAVPVQASLARADATADRVNLEWRLSEYVPEVAIERTRDGDAWAELAQVMPGSLGRVTYEDTDVRAGESLGYRLAFQSDGVLVQTSPAWVVIPMLELVVRVLPTSTRDRLSVEVALISDEPARLELVDISSRQRHRRDLPAGAGTHHLEIPLGGIEPSVAWLRLRQGREARTLRLAITR